MYSSWHIMTECIHEVEPAKGKLFSRPLHVYTYWLETASREMWLLVT